MRVRLVEHGVRCPEIMEDLHHPLHVSPLLGPREEFAVGERTGSSFAETVVGLGVEPFVPVEQCYVAFAGADLFAALVDDRFDTLFYQCQCGKEPCGTGSYNDYFPFGIMHIPIDWRLVRELRVFFDGITFLVN